MRGGGLLKLSTPTDREIVMTREFDVPKRLVVGRVRDRPPRGWRVSVRVARS
jgi:hypothetical protein